MRFIQAAIIGIVIWIASLASLRVMLELDNIEVKQSKKSMLIMLITSVMAACFTAYLTPISADTADRWISVALFIALFNIQSFMDIKTKQVYDLPTLIVLIYSILDLTSIIIKYDKAYLISSGRVIPVLIALGLLVLLSKIGGLGGGDTFIYSALAVHYLAYSEIPWFTMLISVCFASLLFVIFSGIGGLIRHDASLQKHRPFTLYLSIAAMLTLI